MIENRKTFIVNMHKHVKEKNSFRFSLFIFLFSLLLFNFSYSTYAQANTSTNNYGYAIPDITSEFLENDIYFERGEIISNVLKLTNTTSKKISFYLELTIPNKWRTLSKNNRIYELEANDSMFIPVRIIPGELSKGNTKYMFGCFIYSDEGEQLNYCFFSSYTKKIINWTLDVYPFSKLYFLNNKPDVNFSVQIANNGNEDQDIYIALNNIGKGSYLTDTTDNIIKQKSNTINLKTNSDTTFYYKMNYQQNDRNNRFIDLENYIPYSNNDEKKYTLSINTSLPKQYRNNSFSASKRIDFLKLSNVKKVNPYGYRVIPLIMEINIYNFLADHPMMNIILNGNTQLKNNATLSYFTQATFETNYLSKRPIQNLPFYIGYITKKYSVEVGNVGFIGGKGIKGKYEINSNNTISAYIAKSPNLFNSTDILSFGLNYHCRISQNINFYTQYDHLGFISRKSSTDRLINNLNFSIFKKHKIGLTFGGSQNYNYQRSDSTFYKYGYIIGFNYGSHFFDNKYKTRLTLNYTSPYFSQISNTNYINNNERIQGNFENDIKVSKKYKLNLTNNYNSYTVNVHNPVYRTYKNSFLLNQLNIIKSFSNGMNFLPNVFYNINTVDSLTSHSRGIGLGFSKYNYESQNRFNLSLKGGYSKAINYIDDKNYFFFQGSMQKQYKTISFNVLYNYGYNTISRYIFSSVVYPQSLNMNIKYQYLFNNPSFVFYPYASYTYSNLTGNSLNLSNELYYFTRTGWRFKIGADFNAGLRSDNIKRRYYNALLNAENETKKNKISTSINFNFNIRKEFGIPIPSKTVLYNTTEFIAFLDLNGNHQKDKNEDLLENVVISVYGNEVLTNDKGYAKIENIEVGNYPYLVFSLVDLKGWFPYKEDTIEMTTNQCIKYVPFVRGVKIFGAIIMDRDKYSNSGDVLDLSRIKISAYDGKVYTTLTGYDGSFELFVPTGKYTLALDENILGEKFKLTQNNIELDISNEIDNLYIPFYIVEKKRKVIRKKFDSSGSEINDNGNINLNNNDTTKQKNLNFNPDNNNNVNPGNNNVTPKIIDFTDSGTVNKDDLNKLNDLINETKNNNNNKKNIDINKNNTPNIVDVTDSGFVSNDDIKKLKNLIDDVSNNNKPNTNNKNILSEDSKVKILNAKNNKGFYGIQVKSSKEPLDVNFFKDSIKSVYDNFDTLYEVYDDTSDFKYKYAVGRFKSYKDAKKYNETNKNVVDTGAFVLNYGYEKDPKFVSINDLQLKGLSFRVQIASAKNKVSPEFFITKFNLKEDVYLFQDDDKLYKYSVGNLNTLKEALKFKDEMYKKYQVVSFVTPYFNGKRLKYDEFYKIAKKSGLK